MSTETMHRIDAKDTVLLVIDVQERLYPAMDESLATRLKENVLRLAAAEKVLGFSALISEQYPKGLGRTLPEIRDAFSGAEPKEKLCFAATGDQAIAAALWESKRRTVLVSGMETHICVYQTVRALCAERFDVYVLEDAVASRSVLNYEVGLKLCERVGAVRTSTETVLFDMLGKAGTEEFKAISKIVR